MRTHGSGILIATIALIQGFMLAFLSGSIPFLLWVLVPVAYEVWLAWWTVARVAGTTLSRSSVAVTCVIAAAAWELFNAYIHWVVSQGAHEVYPGAVAFILVPTLLALTLAHSILLREYAR